jgi:hypothetical protein
MEIVLKLLIAGLLLAGVWYMFQPRYLFVVQIRGDELRVTKGKVTAAFLQEIAAVCKDHQLRSGWVGGVPRGRNIALAFSRGMPPACQQQLRNLWLLHR